jgi:hypothetical protein
MNTAFEGHGPISMGRSACSKTPAHPSLLLEVGEGIAFPASRALLVSYYDIGIKITRCQANFQALTHFLKVCIAVKLSNVFILGMMDGRPEAQRQRNSQADRWIGRT